MGWNPAKNRLACARLVPGSIWFLAKQALKNGSWFCLFGISNPGPAGSLPSQNCWWPEVWTAVAQSEVSGGDSNVPQRVFRVYGTWYAMECALGTAYSGPNVPLGVFHGTWVPAYHKVTVSCKVPKFQCAMESTLCFWYPGHSVLRRVMGDAGWRKVSLRVFLRLLQSVSLESQTSLFLLSQGRKLWQKHPGPDSSPEIL